MRITVDLEAPDVDAIHLLRTAAERKFNDGVSCVLRHPTAGTQVGTVKVAE